MAKMTCKKCKHNDAHECDCGKWCCFECDKELHAEIDSLHKEIIQSNNWYAKAKSENEKLKQQARNSYEYRRQQIMIIKRLESKLKEMTNLNVGHVNELFDAREKVVNLEAKLRSESLCDSKLKEITDVIDKGILTIDKDERYHYKPACAQTNAPLALVQMDLEARMHVMKKLKKILQEAKE